MVTQSETSSPFQNDNNTQPLNNPKAFSFQTMQDDLLSMQKNGTLNGNVKTETPPTKELSKNNADFKVPAQDFSKKTTFIEGNNPFLNQSSVSDGQKKTSIEPQSTISQKMKTIEMPTDKKKISQPNSYSYRITLSIIVILIISIAGLSGYYFWMTRIAKEKVSEVQQPITETTPQPSAQTQNKETAIIMPPIEKYSTEKPNFLTLDLTNLSTEEIKAAITSKANEIKNENNSAVYEFKIVDANNNPISFPIFAIAAKLKFIPELLASLGQDFSFFIYNDENNIRTGLSISISKPELLPNELQKQEKTFITDASFLFLDAVPEINNGLFTKTTYKDNTINYLNVNTQKNLSIDYSMDNSRLIIGTSKNTARAIIDKQSLSTSTQIQKQGKVGDAPISNTPTSK